MLWILLILAAVIIISVFADCCISVKRIQIAAELPENSNIILIPVTNHTTDIRRSLENAFTLQLCSELKCRCIICDFGADSDTMLICRSFADAHHNFIICSGEYAENLLQFM